jgi:hypothetical protein
MEVKLLMYLTVVLDAGGELDVPAALSRGKKLPKFPEPILT